MTAVTSTSAKRGLLPPAALLIILMMLSGQAMAFDSDSDTICDDDIDVTGVCTAGPAGGDNCPLIPNTDQRNTDGSGDGGDACDDDDDNDMICDGGIAIEGVCIAGPDNCRTISNNGQADSNGNGCGDLCDLAGCGAAGCIDTVIKPLFAINLSIASMANYRNMAISLSGCFYNQGDTQCADGAEEIVIAENGLTTFSNTLEAGSLFAVSIGRNPGRQNCELSESTGQIGNTDETVIVSCEDDESAALFNTNKLHKIRITMTQGEWKSFALDYERANYKNGDASGFVHPWGEFFWSHSEVYRQADFEYLDSQGGVLESFPNIGFKMKGNTSRQVPQVNVIQQDGTYKLAPKRFSFAIKFDEKFDEDEGVYSCIDAAGSPAAVSGPPCENRVGNDLVEVVENDGRSFMGVEKVYFRYNRDDPSYQRELLAHTILNEIGVPTSRMSHASIELVLTGDGVYNNEPLPQSFNMGVFQMTEQIDKPFLKRFFGGNGYLFKANPGGDLSKPSSVDPLCVPYEDDTGYVNPQFCEIGVEKSDPASREEWLGTDNYLNPAFVNSDINDEGGEVSQFKPYKPTYDLKSKKSKIKTGRDLLKDFINFVQTNPSSEILAEQFDVQGFIKAQAADIAMGAPDHYARVANNFYLYFNPITSKWTYIPNDYDFVFRDHHPQWGVSLSAFQDLASTYAFTASGKIAWTDRELGNVTPILWDIIFSDTDNKDALYNHLKLILDNQFDWENSLSSLLNQRDNLVKDVIESTAAVSPTGCQHEYNNEAIDGDAGATLCDINDISIRRFIELRKTALGQELQDAGI
jgi:hypothetical protein